MEGTRIRRYESKDLDAVVELLFDLNRHNDTPHTVEQDGVARVVEEMVGRPDIYRILIAEAGGEAAGLLSLVFYRTLFHNGGTALINELVVREDLRGKGVGRRLVYAAVEEARSTGMDELEVATERENAVAQEFYRRSGFTGEYVLFGMDL